MLPSTLTLHRLYPLSEETLAYGQAFASALLGLDDLARRDRGVDSGFVFMNVAGRESLLSEPLFNWRHARERFEELARQAEFLPEEDRRTYNRRACSAAIAFVDYCEGGLPFREQLVRMVEASPEPVSEEELDVLRAEMHQLLGEMDFRGPLVDRMAEWECRNMVPPEAIGAILQEMLNEARDRAEASLIPVPVDDTDLLVAETITEAPFLSALDYRNRVLHVNTDPVTTWAGLRQMAVFEGYGGHFMQLRLREHYVEEGLAPVDNLLELWNSPSSNVIQGIACAAMEMMGWAETHNDRLQYLLARYRAGITTGAAWRLHVRGWTDEQVRDWLTEESMAGGAGWVDTRLRFIGDPFRALRVWSHWWGEPIVAEAWWRVPREDRRDFLRFLYGRMHSAESVGMYQA